MQPSIDSKPSRDAMKTHGMEGVFFCTFSSKKATAHFSLNNYTQSISGEFSCCSFTGKERDEETGYGYFGARYMDHELMTSWLSVDPMADKYPSISPYNYCMWNPVKLIDPDGRDVLPCSDEAYEMILRSIPVEARAYVKRNSDGYIDRDLINSYSCESQNFNDLKELVNLDCVIEVAVSQEYEYLDKDNNPKTNKYFSTGIYVYPEESDWFDVEGTTPNFLSTGEVGCTGVTQYPESSAAWPSTNGNVKVHVNSLLSPQGRAEIFAHEFFGHAYIYATTGDVHAASHWPAKDENNQDYDANSRLHTRIINAKREVINNNK